MRRRDLQQQIQAERIRQALKQDDRTEARQRMAAAAIRRTPQAPAPAQQADDRAPALQQPHQHHLQLPEQAADSRSDEDGELQRLRQQRLRQLQAESAAKQEGLREGYGMLNTVPESSVVVSEAASWMQVPYSPTLCAQSPAGRNASTFAQPDACHPVSSM